jgi:mRNA-degrading endonuclease RelE of RelBE toxin-antitoxin system
MYEIIIEQQAKKYLKKLLQEIRQRINQAIHSLSDSPRPPGSVKLKGE